jgi:hypothetical protein
MSAPIVRDNIEIPTVYQRVEYIQSNGAQWIETGVNTTSSVSYEFDLCFAITEGGPYVALSDGSSTYGTNFGQHNGQFSIYSSYPISGSNSGVRSIVSGYIDGGRQNLEVRGVGSIGFPFDGSASKTYKLFHSADWMGDAGSVILWRCKFFDNGVLIRDLIPCYRKSDGKPGMWDMVSWQFFTNAGSGADFTVGPDVVQPATKYIVFEDRAVEAICVANWSSDGIGLTMEDAAAVTSISSDTFGKNSAIVSFDELKFFTGLQSLANYQFQRTSGLKRITIPSHLASLGQGVFSGAFDSGSRVDIGSVTSLGYACFYDSSNLGTMVIHSLIPPTIGNAALYGLDNTSFYVPYSSDHSVLDAYKAASGWSTYASKIYELNPDGTIPS